jgi:hypothetical protein
MPIPNVSSLYIRIQNGAEGGMEFSRIIDKLLISEAQEGNYNYTAYSDRAGDYKGVDGIMVRDIEKTGFQHKFYSSPLSANHKHDIKLSLSKAISKFPDMAKWIVVIPDDPNKNDLEWFESMIGEQNCPAEIWGHKYIINLMLKHKHIADEYYPELNSSHPNEKSDHSGLSPIKKGANRILKSIAIIMILLIVAFVTYCVTNDKNNHRPAIIR